VKLKTIIEAIARNPRNRAIDDVLEMMDDIERESRRAVTFCQDCGSRRIATRWPDGSQGYMSGHPDYPRTDG
jgi:hypothetical protein